MEEGNQNSVGGIEKVNEKINPNAWHKCPNCSWYRCLDPAHHDHPNHGLNPKSYPIFCSKACVDEYLKHRVVICESGIRKSKNDTCIIS